MQSAEEFRYLVLAAQREGARALTELLRPFGLTPAQSEVLAVLREAQRGLTVRELGERLVCEAGSPSRLASSLVASGLVSRGTRASDRRATELTLTAAGLDAARDVSRAESQLYALLDRALNPSELRHVSDTLHKLVSELPSGRALQRRRDERRQ